MCHVVLNTIWKPLNTIYLLLQAEESDAGAQCGCLTLSERGQRLFRRGQDLSDSAGYSDRLIRPADNTHA